MNAEEIQNLFTLNVVLGFKKYCKDKHINESKLMDNKGSDKLHKQTLYDVIKGKRKSLPIISLCYLAALLNLDSPSKLEMYYLKENL